jgi:cobalt-zinc-cadmium efflux system membrane fusion protein
LLVLLTALAACTHHEELAPVVGPKVEQGQIRFPAGSRQLDVLKSVPAEAAAASMLTLPARLGWDDTHTSRVHSAMAGQVAAIKVAPGQAVKAGDTLALIASPEFGEAQAERVKSEVELRQADRQLKRSRELHDAGIVSGRDLEEAEATWASASADNARTAARAKLYGGASTIDQSFPLRSPIDGIVVDRKLNPGQAVGPEQGDDSAPFTVSDPRYLWLLIDVPENLADRIETDLPVHFVLADGTRIDSRLDHVADFVDPETRVVAARASIDNSQRRLKAGGYVRAEIALPAGSGVDVPSAGVLLIDHRRVVFIDEGNGVYRRQQVSGEEVSEGRIRIHEGLAPGARVVVAGALFLQQLLDANPLANAATANNGTNAQVAR